MQFQISMQSPQELWLLLQAAVASLHGTLFCGYDIGGVSVLTCDPSEALQFFSKCYYSPPPMINRNLLDYYMDKDYIIKVLHAWWAHYGWSWGNSSYPWFNYSVSCDMLS
jgi:hypothetical protein